MSADSGAILILFRACRHAAKSNRVLFSRHAPGNITHDWHQPAHEQAHWRRGRHSEYYPAHLADRTPAEIKALIAKLDEVCRQAKELQKTLRLQMLDRSRRERVYERSGKLTRKKPPR